MPLENRESKHLWPWELDLCPQWLQDPGDKEVLPQPGGPQQGRNVPESSSKHSLPRGWRWGLSSSRSLACARPEGALVKSQSNCRDSNMAWLSTLDKNTKTKRRALVPTLGYSFRLYCSLSLSTEWRGAILTNDHFCSGLNMKGHNKVEANSFDSSPFHYSQMCWNDFPLSG